MADLRDDDNPSPWIPESIPYRIAILGKALEEVGELGEVLALIKTNGVYSEANGLNKLLGRKSYRQCLSEEIADVSSLILHLEEAFELYQQAWNGKQEPGAAVSSLVNALARVLIQGIDECEPVTKLANRAMLERRVTDVRYICQNLVSYYELDETAILERRNYKYKYLLKWLVQLGYEPKTA